MAAQADKGTLVFRPYYPQSGRGPHLLDWAYCTDTAWDSFPSNITSPMPPARIMSPAIRMPPS